MVDTFTDLLRLRKPEVGANDDAWAPPTTGGLNDGVIGLLDEAMAQAASIDVTGGNVTLTKSNGISDTHRPFFLQVSGTPGVARDVTVPDPPTSKLYVVENLSDSQVTIKTVSGTGVMLNVNNRLLCYVDATLDDVFAIQFLGNVVTEAPAWITGTVDIQNATAGDTSLTYRYSNQGSHILFQLPTFSSTITPGAAFTQVNLPANTPATFPADLLPSFSQSIMVYLTEAGTVVPWFFRMGASLGNTMAFVRGDTGTTVPNGTVIALPHNITWTLNDQGF